MLLIFHSLLLILFHFPIVPMACACPIVCCHLSSCYWAFSFSIFFFVFIRQQLYFYISPTFVLTSLFSHPIKACQFNSILRKIFSGIFTHFKSVCLVIINFYFIVIVLFWAFLSLYYYVDMFLKSRAKNSAPKKIKLILPSKLHWKGLIFLTHR